MRQSLYDYCTLNNRIDLLMQWDTDANLPLTPKTVTSGSSRKVWWFCEKGHRWQQAPWERTAKYLGCPVCRGKRIIPGINDLKTLIPDVVDEWNYERNGTLRPENIFPYSHRKVWWKCRECGHEWLAQVKARAGTQKCGCPVCANRMVIPGQNDLATEYPEVAASWHPKKNRTLSPQEVPSGTTRKVWWKCSVCGNEWEAAVSSRTHGSGCPICAGKVVAAGVNDFASQYPEIAREWHPTKNGKLMPNAVTGQSNKSVWWVCPEGHEYKAIVSSRTTSGSGCPYCANRRVLVGFNDLASQLPKVAKEWHPTLNGSLTPEHVTCGSAKKVWWKCNACGYEWKAIIYSRAGAQRCGCPMCAGKVKVTAKQEYYRRITFDANAPVHHPEADAEKTVLHITSSSGPGPPGSRARSSDPP